MTVYVDDAQVPFGTMKMSHMVADSNTELVRFAVDELNLEGHWIQDPGTPREHFDVSQPKRREAVEKGARPVSQNRLNEIIREKEGG